VVRLFVVCPGGVEPPIEGEHLFDQRNHSVMALPVGQIS
jgi:hypothetical protein